MTRYAANTTVPPDKSRGEIERTIKRYSGDLVSFGWSSETVEVVAFRMRGRFLRFEVRHPKRDPYGTERQHEREIWRRWRVCLLQIKTKLELVSEDAETFDREMLAYFVLPDGSTIGDRMDSAAVDDLFARGEIPPMLRALPSGVGEATYRELPGGDR